LIPDRVADGYPVGGPTYVSTRINALSINILVAISQVLPDDDGPPGTILCQLWISLSDRSPADDHSIRRPERISSSIDTLGIDIIAAGKSRILPNDYRPFCIICYHLRIVLIIYGVADGHSSGAPQKIPAAVDVLSIDVIITAPIVPPRHNGPPSAIRCQPGITLVVRVGANSHPAMCP